MQLFTVFGLYLNIYCIWLICEYLLYLVYMRVFTVYGLYASIYCIYIHYSREKKRATTPKSTLHSKHTAHDRRRKSSGCTTWVGRTMGLSNLRTYSCTEASYLIDLGFSFICDFISVTLSLRWIAFQCPTTSFITSSNSPSALLSHLRNPGSCFS